MSYVGSYLWQLRQVWGTKPLLSPGVAIIVTDPDGKFWCGKRTVGGEWSYPGGSVELGQSVEDCLRAELFEETGLELTDYAFAGVCSQPDRARYTYPNGDEVQIINFVFEVPRLGRPLKIDEEHSEFAAFDINDLPQPFKPDSVYGMEVYRAYRRTGKVQLG